MKHGVEGATEETEADVDTHPNLTAGLQTQEQAGSHAATALMHFLLWLDTMQCPLTYFEQQFEKNYAHIKSLIGPFSLDFDSFFTLSFSEFWA